MKPILLWLILALLTADSVLRLYGTKHLTFGAVLMLTLTGGMLSYTLLYRQIDAFLSSPAGKPLRLLLAAGIVLVLGIALFLCVAGGARLPIGTERAIIVLGAAVRGSAVSSVLAHRLDTALAYAQAHPDLPIVVSGGKGPDEDISEAAAMKQYLVERGVPASRILTEDKSTSTEENFKLSKQLLSLHGISADEPVVFVTNRFHCYRAGGYAQLAGFSQARALPAGLPLAAVVPSYLREICAVLYYWVLCMLRSV